MKSIFECALSFVPVAGATYSSIVYVTSIDNAPVWQVGLNLANALGSVALEFVDFTPPGIIWNVAWCLWGFKNACPGAPGGGGGGGGGGNPFRSISSRQADGVNLAAQNLLVQAGYVIDIYKALNYPFDDDIWMRSPNLTIRSEALNLQRWLNDFVTYASDGSSQGRVITSGIILLI